MSFKSHIYDRQGIDDDKIYEWPLTFLAGLVLVLGFVLIEVHEGLAVTMMFLSPIIIFYANYKNRGMLEEEGECLGEICLTSDLFILNNETFRTADIYDIWIAIGEKKGHINYHGRMGHTLDSGTTSVLEFVSNGLKRHYNFKLYSDTQIADLKEVLEGLYEKGIFVKEFYHGKRTYLFDDLNYQEIQDFKRKYKLG